MKLFFVYDYNGQITRVTTCGRKARIALSETEGDINIKVFDIWEQRYWVGTVIVFIGIAAIFAQRG
jgi:hypothetical protein